MAQNKHPILLLITDSPIKGAFFRKHLKEEFHLIYCETQEEAFDHLTSLKIDFIIVDEKSYGISIFEFCEKLRKISKLEETPLLVITSQLKKKFTRKLLKMGVTDFLREPLEEDELFSRIELAKRFHKMHQKISSISKNIHITPKNPIDLKKISSYQDLDDMLKQVTNYFDEAKKGESLIITH